MNITDSLSTLPDIFNEHYSISHARHVFSRMKDRCPKQYEEKRISIAKAADILNIDTRTLHQRIKKGIINPKIEQSENGYVKTLLVSLRDLADMLIEHPLKPCACQNRKRYTDIEIEELKNTGRVIGRTYNSYKVKAFRLGIKIGKKRNLNNDSIDRDLYTM